MSSRGVHGDRRLNCQGAIAGQFPYQLKSPQPSSHKTKGCEDVAAYSDQPYCELLVMDGTGRETPIHTLYDDDLRKMVSEDRILTVTFTTDQRDDVRIDVQLKSILPSVSGAHPDPKGRVQGPISCEQRDKPRVQPTLPSSPEHYGIGNMDGRNDPRGQTPSQFSNHQYPTGQMGGKNKAYDTKLTGKHRW